MSFFVCLFVYGPVALDKRGSQVHFFCEFITKTIEAIRHYLTYNNKIKEIQNEKITYLLQISLEIYN